MIRILPGLGSLTNCTRRGLALIAAMAVIGAGTATMAEDTPARSVHPPKEDSGINHRDLGTRTRREAKPHGTAKLHEFLEYHPKLANSLRHDPNLLEDKAFLRKHRRLREILEAHPEAGRELRARLLAKRHAVKARRTHRPQPQHKERKAPPS